MAILNGLEIAFERAEQRICQEYQINNCSRTSPKDRIEKIVSLEANRNFQILVRAHHDFNWKGMNTLKICITCDQGDLLHKSPFYLTKEFDLIQREGFGGGRLKKDMEIAQVLELKEENPSRGTLQVRIVGLPFDAQAGHSEEMKFRVKSLDNTSGSAETCDDQGSIRLTVTRVNMERTIGKLFDPGFGIPLKISEPCVKTLRSKGITTEFALISVGKKKKLTYENLSIQAATPGNARVGEFWFQYREPKVLKGIIQQGGSDELSSMSQESIPYEAIAHGSPKFSQHIENSNNCRLLFGNGRNKSPESVRAETTSRTRSSSGLFVHDSPQSVRANARSICSSPSITADDDVNLMCSSETERGSLSPCMRRDSRKKSKGQASIIFGDDENEMSKTLISNTKDIEDTIEVDRPTTVDECNLVKELVRKCALVEAELQQANNENNSLQEQRKMVQQSVLERRLEELEEKLAAKRAENEQLKVLISIEKRKAEDFNNVRDDKAIDTEHRVTRNHKQTSESPKRKRPRQDF